MMSFDRPAKLSRHACILQDLSNSTCPVLPLVERFSSPDEKGAHRACSFVLGAMGSSQI